MAHRYSAASDSSGPITTGGVYAEMLAGATKPISVRAIRVTTNSNVGGHISLERAYAIGTGAGTGIATAVSHRLSSPVSTARLQFAWSSAPTGYISKIRDEVLPLATGSHFDLWRQDDGPLVLEPNASLLIVNQGSGINGGGLHVNVTWEEGPASDN